MMIFSVSVGSCRENIFFSGNCKQEVRLAPKKSTENNSLFSSSGSTNRKYYSIKSGSLFVSNMAQSHKEVFSELWQLRKAN